MQTASFKFAAGVALQVMVAAGLLVLAADVQARGKRGKSGSNKADDDAPRQTQVVVRHSSSSSSSSSSQAPGLGNNLIPIDGAGGGFQSLEDPAERAARRAEIERTNAAKAQAALAEAARADAQRVALERAANERATAEDRRIAAKLAAEQDKKQREEAALAAEADLILQRAMTDYPVLKTPAGAHLVQQIRERQITLAQRGLYPSVAMVEAVADHAHALAPRPWRVPVVATPAARTAQPAVSLGNCRWATPLLWKCD